MSNSEDSGDVVPCPCCEEIVISDGISSGLCENWLHYHCENLTNKEIVRLTQSDDPYHCQSCVFDSECQNFDSHCQDLEDLTSLANDRNTEENDPAPLDENTRMKTISPPQSSFGKPVSRHNTVPVTCNLLEDSLLDKTNTKPSAASN